MLSFFFAQENDHWKFWQCLPTITQLYFHCITFYFQHQFQVRAYDSGEPRYDVTANVTVIVRRNLNVPIFTISSYYQRIHETFPVGDVVIDAMAADLDMVSLSIQ